MSASRPVRCTILSPYVDQHGGAELSLMHALRLGRQHGIEWALAVPRDGEIPMLARELGLDVTHYGESRTRDPIGYVRSIVAIRRLIRSHQSEMLLSWDAFPHYRGFAAAIAAGVPSVWFQKGGVAENPATRRHARLPARAILANSTYTADRQFALQESVNKRRPIYVVPSAVDLVEFGSDRVPCRDACRRELGLPLDQPIVALVGRLQAWKGFHVLVEAAKPILAEHPGTRFLLIGGEHWSEPDYPEQLRERVCELGITNAVDFAGRVPHDAVARYVQSADVLVHASVGEPFGIVVIEAMAMGKAVVAASQGGPTMVVRDGVDGLLADPTNPNALANSILRILRDKSLAERLGQAAAERATLFNTDAFGTRLAWALRSIRDRQHGPGVVLDDSLAADQHGRPRP
ncbi:MAG: glycosyltransferase family 4 protein [Planctomycetota bacterium]